MYNKERANYLLCLIGYFIWDLISLELFCFQTKRQEETKTCAYRQSERVPFFNWRFNSRLKKWKRRTQVEKDEHKLKKWKRRTQVEKDKHRLKKWKRRTRVEKDEHRLKKWKRRTQVEKDARKKVSARNKLYTL
jgi:hypothetical protein